ncbi:MAG: hypothetical protein K6347_08370 [Campylobacterales bacterium]
MRKQYISLIASAVVAGGMVLGVAGCGGSSSTATTTVSSVTQQYEDGLVVSIPQGGLVLEYSDRNCTSNVELNATGGKITFTANQFQCTSGTVDLGGTFTVKLLPGAKIDSDGEAISMTQLIRMSQSFLLRVNEAMLSCRC